MKMKTLIPVLVLTVTISAFFGFTSYLFLKETKKNHLPVYGQVDRFQLIDAAGNPFESKKLAEKIWVANFFFTTCGDICPIMSKHLASLHRSFALEKDVHFVSISVNPEQDSPEALTNYAKKYNIKDNQWSFLTGSREDITKLAVQSFKVGAMDEPVFHSNKFILVDKYQQIRGYYDGTTAEGTQELFRDLGQLVKDQ